MKNHKFKQSKDGQLRCDFTITIRLTQDELSEYDMMAKVLGYKDFKEFAEPEAHHIGDALEAAYEEREEDLDG